MIAIAHFSNIYWQIKGRLNFSAVAGCGSVGKWLCSSGAASEKIAEGNQLSYIWGSKNVWSHSPVYDVSTGILVFILFRPIVFLIYKGNKNPGGIITKFMLQSIQNSAVYFKFR